MAVKWIINGYFRSGTTFLWERFRSAADGNVLCLYEPLHPDLPGFIENRGRDESGRRLHQLELWSDYLRIQPARLKRILSCHPNLSARCCWRNEELAAYFREFHTLDKDVMIQCNRLHFDIQCVAELTGARIVHVVRNPVEVFHSIRHVYFTVRGPCRGLVRRIAYPFRGKYAFETAAWVNRARSEFSHTFTEAETCRPGLFPAFVLAWVSANYAAVQSLFPGRGMVCAYEELFLQPLRLAGDFQTFFGVPFPIEQDDVNPRDAINNDKVWKQFNKWVKHWGLEMEWSRIREVVESRGVRWK